MEFCCMWLAQTFTVSIDAGGSEDLVHWWQSQLLVAEGMGSNSALLCQGIILELDFCDLQVSVDDADNMRC